MVRFFGFNLMGPGRAQDGLLGAPEPKGLNGTHGTQTYDPFFGVSTAILPFRVW